MITKDTLDTQRVYHLLNNRHRAYASIPDRKRCVCFHEDKNKRHGPYYLWYRRINGKTATQSIAEEDVQTYRMWIGNREKLESLFQKMVNLGVDYAAVFKSTPVKSPKCLSPMRGK